MGEATRNAGITDQQFRAQLGVRLIRGSIIVIVVLVVAMMAPPLLHDLLGTDRGFKDSGDTAKLLMSTLLPLLSTWVGTVLAFYYSKENFESATRGSIDLVRARMEDLARTPVSSAMIPAGQVRSLKLAIGASLEAATFAEVETAFAATVEGRAITRLPIVDAAGVCRAVLHRSMWMEMRVVGAAQTPPVDPKAELGVFLALPRDTSLGKTYGDLIVRSFRTIAPDRSLADAKSMMESNPLYQDVFVTDAGRPDGPMLGWVTNVVIGKASRA